MITTIDEFQREVERAWAHAPPGHEAAERNALLRELQRRLRGRPSSLAFEFRSDLDLEF
jgi:hypothetical protein